MIWNLLLEFWPYLAAAGGAILALFTARQSGKKSERAKVARDRVKRGKEGRDAVVEEQAETDGLSTVDIVDRMRRR